MYQRAWAGPPPTKKDQEAISDDSVGKTNDEPDGTAIDKGENDDEKGKNKNVKTEENKSKEDDQKNDSESKHSGVSSPSHSPSAPPAELVQGP